MSFVILRAAHTAPAAGARVAARARGRGTCPRGCATRECAALQLVLVGGLGLCHVSCYTSAALTLLRLCCFLRFWSLRRGLFLFVVCVCCWVVLAVLCVCGCWVGLHRLVRCVVDLCVLCSFFRRRFCVARVGDVRWSGGVWRGRGWRVLVSGGTVCARVVRCSWVWGGAWGGWGGAGVGRVALEGACECWWPVVCGRRSCVVAILAGVSYLWECRVSDSGSGRARGVCWLWALQEGACVVMGARCCAPQWAWRGAAGGHTGRRQLS